MNQGLHHPIRRAVPRFVAALCVAGTIAGVALCMVQGSGSKSLRLAAAAQVYYARAQHGRLPAESTAYLHAAARETMLQAIALDPGQAQHWYLLSDILLHQQAFGPASQALAVAENMGEREVFDLQQFAADPPPDSIALETP